MTTKLDWNYDQTLNCEVAYLRGYRIRAEQDTCASNPFEDQDGNWPIMVYYDRTLTDYDKVKGVSTDAPLYRFTDVQLVFDQKAIGSILDVSRADFDSYLALTDDCDTCEAPKWITDVDMLRQAFDDALDNVYKSDRLGTYKLLYDLLGIPAYLTTSRGYSQGDWAEVLVVATPEAQAEFGCKEVTEKDLEATADLYGAWAWGDVYGYIVEKPVFDEDGEIEEWEEVPDGSCWGYYGNDHDESGLEEQALACVPEEPVRLPDAMQEAEPCDANS